MEHKRVCVIAVHPDDETLGCGGTILKHIADGDEVSCIFVTGGNAEQKKLISYVATAYNFAYTFALDFQELAVAGLSLNDIIPRVYILAVWRLQSTRGLIAIKEMTEFY